MALATINNVYLAGSVGIVGLLQGYGAMTFFVISTISVFIGIIILDVAFTFDIEKKNGASNKRIQ